MRLILLLAATGGCTAGQVTIKDDGTPVDTDASVDHSSDDHDDTHGDTDVVGDTEVPDDTDVPCATPVAGATRIGIFRDGVWRMDEDGDGVWRAACDTSFAFGDAGDRPLTGDWTGDGHVRIGLFRPVGSDVHWILDLNGNRTWDQGVDGEYLFGISTDLPITGDWTGSGTTRIGVFRPSDSTWGLDLDNDRFWTVSIDRTSQFGLGTAQPVSGDWTGSGLDRIGVLTPTQPDAEWSLDLDGDGVWDAGHDRAVTFGTSGDIGVVGDWDGDGTDELAVYRDGTWRFHTVGGDVVRTFGSAGDTPIAFRASTAAP